MGVGNRFAVGHACEQTNQVQLFEYQGSDDKPTLIQTIATSKDYVYEVSPNYVAVAYSLNLTVEVYRQPFFVKKFVTFFLDSQSTFKAMSIADAANLIHVSVGTQADSGRVTSYRLTNDYTVHSVLDFAAPQGFLATIDNQAYEDQGYSDKYLFLSLPAYSFSSGSCFNFFEIFSLGPHALVDYSGLTSLPADGLVDINISISRFVGGTNETTVNQTKLRLTDIDYSVNVTAFDTNKIEAKVGIFNISSLASVKGAVGPGLMVNTSDAYVVQGYDVQPTLMNYTQNFDKSVMSQQYLFASASEGLTVFDVQKQTKIWSVTPEVCLSPVGLSKVEGLEFDDVRFYALC